MDPETQTSSEAQRATALGRALAFGVLGLSLLLVLLASSFVLQLSELSLAGLWYRFQQGGSGMWAIFLALLLGVALLLALGIVQLLRPRAPLWPLLLMPALACVAGFAFERQGVTLAAEVVLSEGIDDGQRLRIFAMGASEALNTRLFATLTAGLLLVLAASVLSGRALLQAQRLAWSGAAARAFSVGAGLTLSCFAYAWWGQPASRVAVSVAAFGAGTATLLCALFGLTTQPQAGRAPLTARLSMWLSAAALVAGMWCFAAFSEAFADSQLFAAVGGEAVPDNLAATRMGEALQVSSWARRTLPWMALLPVVIALVTVPPTALKAMGQARHPASELWLFAGVLVLGVGAVGAGRVATAASLQRCVDFANVIVPPHFELMVASGGRPQRWNGTQPLVWVGKDSIVVKQDDGPELNAPTFKLLEPACDLRLSPAQGHLLPLTIFVDASLTARHLKCLLPALLQLKPTHEGAWTNGHADNQRRPTWGLLWDDGRSLPEPYDQLARRAVLLKFGMAVRRANVHLELQDAYWDLQRGPSPLRIEGDLAQRLALLRKALEGKAVEVSIASAPQVPAPFVLNAALAVSDAKCAPQLWVPGYSMLEPPTPVGEHWGGRGFMGGSRWAE